MACMANRTLVGEISVQAQDQRQGLNSIKTKVHIAYVAWRAGTF